MILVSSFLCFLIFIIRGSQSCDFPAAWSGTWKGADRGNMIFFNSTVIQQYKVNIPNVVHFSFHCLQQRGNIYYMKAFEENNIFGLIIKFYMCLQMHAVDDNIAYYYQLTPYDPYLQDNIVGDGQNIASFESVCSKPAVPRNFVTFVRDGAIADGSINITCPDALQAQFGNVSIQHASTTNPTMCPGTVFDVCTDKTMINITYNDTCATASTAKTLSGLGLYRCIHSLSEGSDTFLAVWKDDPMVTNPFTCFAYNRIGDVIYATESPKFCSNTSSSTEAQTGGVKLVIWDILSTCEIIVPTTTEAPPNLAGLWALLILPFLFLLILILLIARYCYTKYGCVCARIKLPKRKKKPPPITDDGTGTADIVSKTVFVPNVIRQPKMYNFRPKKPLTFYPLFDPSWEPTEHPNLQPIAKVEPLYNDSLDDYMRGRLPRRPSGVSLYSFSSDRIPSGKL